MEDEKFSKNSNSKIIDTGPPVESTSDPPDTTTLDDAGPPDVPTLAKGSPQNNSTKVPALVSKAVTRLKNTTMTQRVLTSVIAMILVISTVAGILVFAGSSGTTSGSSSGEFSIDGNCEGEIVYYPFYMISPMKLFYYYSVYDEDSRQKGAAVLRGKSREDEGKAKPVVLKAKNYKLQPNEYYGNTIAGYSDGTLVMTSNAMYTYRDANGNHLSYATKLENHDVVLLRRTEKKRLGGADDKKLSNHIVAFSGDDVNTSVFVGDQKDKAAKGLNADNMTKHIFTNALYEATGNKYDSGSFYSALGDGKWKKVYKKVSGYKKKSFELWEAISRVEGNSSSMTLDPVTKINEYLSPTSAKELHNNYEGGDFFSDLNEAQKQMVRYHELDLLLSLYVIASENDYTNKVDETCVSTWEEVIEAYLKGWENPAEMSALNKGGNIVYDTLAISPAVGMIISGDEYLVPAADYVDMSLGLPSNVSISKPSSANSFSFDCTAGNGRDYIVELCNKALKEGNVSPNGCPAFQKGSGKLGSLNLLQNVVGRYLSEGSSNGCAKLKVSNDSNEPWSSFQGFKLTAHVWGSNLIHLNSENSAKFELPQFSVNLGKGEYIEETRKPADEGDEETPFLVAAEMGKVNEITENPQLNFQLSYNIKGNKDSWFKDAKRKARNLEANKEVFQNFIKNKKTKDLYMVYHLKRFVSVDDLEQTLTSEGTYVEGKMENKIELSKKGIKGRKAKTGAAGTLEKVTEERFASGVVKINGVKPGSNNADDIETLKKNLPKDKALATVKDKRVNNEASDKMKKNNYHVADIWISYQIPNLGESNTGGKTYRYGLLRSALAEKVNNSINNILYDDIAKKYGVYINDETTKEIEVVYKIEEAYIDYTNEGYSDMDEEENKYCPYEEHVSLLDRGELKSHTAIRAAGTGKAVRFLYRFKSFPALKLKPEIEANVGGTLAQTESGGTTNSKDTGIEDTDIKFGTKEGYVKKDSETIGDVPSVIIGFDPDDTTTEWEKFFNDKNYSKIFLSIMVKRELTSEGTLPDNAETVPWSINFNTITPFQTVTDASGSRPYVEINGKGSCVFYYNYLGKLLKTAAAASKETKLRGQSLSELVPDTKPGNVQYSVFSIRLDGDGNKKNFLKLLKGTGASIGDIEAGDTNSGNTTDLKITPVGETNGNSLVVTEKCGRKQSGNDLFTFLDYSMAELSTAGMTDVKATYTVSATLYASLGKSGGTIKKDFGIDLKSSLSKTLAVGADSEGEGEGGAEGEGSSEGESTSSEMTQQDLETAAYSDYVVYYPSDMQRDLVLDTAVNPNDSSTFATDTNTADPVTSTADSSDYKSEHKDTGKNKTYSRKAYVKMSVLSL